MLPDPAKLMVPLYWDAHSLIDQLSTQTLLRLLPKLKEWVKHDRQRGLRPPDGTVGRPMANRTPPTPLNSAAATEPLALVVEDDPAAVDVAAETLTSLGHRFHVARSQEEARRLLKAHDYTYVLLDLEIPARSEHGIARIQNGENLLEEIIGVRENGALPVIIMTSHKAETPDLAAETMRLAASLTKKGATDFINKPFPTAGRTLDRVIRKNLPKKEAADKRPAAPTPASKPKPFQGGELAFCPDRIELCGVTVVSSGKSCQMWTILDTLKQRLDERRYKAFPGSALASKVDGDGGQNGVAGSIRDFRRHVAEELGRELGLMVERDDVIETSKAGYRLNPRIMVKDLRNTGPRPPASGQANPSHEPAGTGPDEPVNERREQIMALIRGGERFRVPGLAEKLQCGYTTVKREVDALKAEGHIEFVGPAKNGYYRLAKATA